MATDNSLATKMAGLKKVCWICRYTYRKMCFSWYTCIYYTWSPYTVINISIYSPATLHKMDLSAKYDSAMSAISPKVNVIVWFSKHLCKKHSFDIIKVYNLSILEESRLTFCLIIAPGSVEKKQENKSPRTGLCVIHRNPYSLHRYIYNSLHLNFYKLSIISYNTDVLKSIWSCTYSMPIYKISFCNSINLITLICYNIL